VDIRTAQQHFSADPGWLNTASYGLPPDIAWNAMQAALADWRHGRVSWEGWSDAVGQSREAFARLVGAPIADVAIGAQVSQMVAPIAASLPAGSTVVAAEEDFTSILFPFLIQERRGVTVRTSPVAKLADAIDGDTDVVAFSIVQSGSGEIADVDAITAAADEAGAITVVDGTQACGWLPVHATSFDAMAVGAYKWLLSPRGTGFLVTNERLREWVVPSQAGWFAGDDPHTSYYGPPLRLASDARRYDISPAWFNWVATAPAIEFLSQVGVEQIQQHNVALANRFRAGLGLEPGDSAIVSADVPGAQDKLEAAGVRAAVRGGQMRTSFHLYTTENDVDMALDALTG
jgi:selenocysteine lyase/cysteine desulfurase